MDDHSNPITEMDFSLIEKEGIKSIKEKYFCRITVLGKVFNEDLYRQYPYGGAHACGRLEEGQVFITNNRWDPPDGFCA